MSEKGEIEQEALDELRDIIKEELRNRIAAMKQYENSMSSAKAPAMRFQSP